MVSCRFISNWWSRLIEEDLKNHRRVGRLWQFASRQYIYPQCHCWARRGLGGAGMVDRQLWQLVSRQYVCIHPECSAGRGLGGSVGNSGSWFPVSLYPQCYCWEGAGRDRDGRWSTVAVRLSLVCISTRSRLTGGREGTGRVVGRLCSWFPVGMHISTRSLQAGIEPTNSGGDRRWC
jgi:hypothetical protein